MRHRALPVLLLAAAAHGCASHHALPAVEANLQRSGVIADPRQAARLARSMTNGEIAALLDVDVRARLPSAVAVAALTSRCAGFQPVLKPLSAEELAGWAEAVKAHRDVPGVLPITRLVHRDDRPTLHSLRTAAARLNCELLLVYLQADSEVDNYNAAAALYWTLVGLWLVPGNVYEHQTVMQAILVDCRTGMILGTAAGDSRRKRLYPLAFKRIQRDRLYGRTAAEALSELQKSFGLLVGRVAAAAAAKG